MHHSAWKLFIVAGLVWVLSASISRGDDVTPGAYTLKADTGRYLARCNGCVPGGAAPDSASLHETNPANPWSKWSFAKRPSGKWVLQSDTGRFLARCNGCGPGAYPDSAFVHETNPDAPWAQWTLLRRANGNWALQSDTGRYLARCNGCFSGSAYPDMAFVHETNPDASWAQWALQPVPTAPATTTPAASTPATPAVATLKETGTNPDIRRLEAAIKALASARLETFPAPTKLASGDFEIGDAFWDHVNGMARLGDVWITNYPSDGTRNRGKGRILSWDPLSDNYTATYFSTGADTTLAYDKQPYPAGMAAMERDKVLAVTAHQPTIRFFSYVGGVKELTQYQFTDPDGENHVRIGIAYNTDQNVYYMLLNTTLWRGRLGSWEKVGTVDWNASSDEESNPLVYLGYNTFATFALGIGKDPYKFRYAIFSVDGKGVPTTLSKDVELTLANKGEAGGAPSFRWAGTVDFNGNTFRICAAPKRLDASGNFYCWTSPVGTTQYSVKITTGTDAGAGTDSNIYLSLVGPRGTTMETRLNDLISGNAFEAGNTDTVNFAAGDVGTPTSAKLRSDGFFAASDWRPTGVELTVGLVTKMASPSAWLNRGSTTLSLLTKKTYAVKIKTGTKTGAGTDANIFLTINGVATRLNGLISGNAFENGDLDSVSVTQAVASDTPVRSIAVRSDGQYAGADWYLEYIDVDGGRFTCNCWLNGATSKTLSR